MDKTLEREKDKLEEILLDWLWFATKTKRSFRSDNQLTIYFEDGISLHIQDGIYYFEKTYYSKDDMQDDKSIEFMIIYPEAKNYDCYTLHLKEIVLENFKPKEEEKLYKLTK